MRRYPVRPAVDRRVSGSARRLEGRHRRGHHPHRAFTDVFHADGGCRYGPRGKDLPAAEFNRLRRLIRDLPFWHSTMDVNQPEHLRFDESRLEQLAEAWVPVLTPYGRGVLLYKNCD